MFGIHHQLNQMPDLEQRAATIKEDTISKRGAIQQRNNLTILDIEERFGLRIGDLVRYTNRIGVQREGYIAFFFIRFASLSDFTFRDQQLLFAIVDGSPSLDYEKGITPVIIDRETGEYYTHRERIPEKVDG